MSSSPELHVRPFLPGVVPGRRPVAGAVPGRGHADGFAAGYATGYSEGLRRAAAATADARQQSSDAAAAQREAHRVEVGRLLLAVRAATVQLAEDATEDAAVLAGTVARCAAELARHVVLDAAPTPPALLARVHRALGELPRGEATTVHVSTDGVRTLERAGLLPDGLPVGVVVVADDRLDPGDVVVRAGASTVTDLLRRAVDDVTAAMTGEDQP